VLASGSPAEIAANAEVQQRYLGTRLDYLEHAAEDLEPTP
jgi:hypothetical protein